MHRLKSVMLLYLLAVYVDIACIVYLDGFTGKTDDALDIVGIVFVCVLKHDHIKALGIMESV